MISSLIQFIVASRVVGKGSLAWSCAFEELSGAVLPNADAIVSSDLLGLDARVMGDCFDGDAAADRVGAGAADTTVTDGPAAWARWIADEDGDELGISSEDCANDCITAAHATIDSEYMFKTFDMFTYVVQLRSFA